MRLGLHGLTTRGRSFVAAGGAAVVCAVLFGQRDLLRVGVLVLVLPLLCAVVVARTRFRLSSSRRLEPARLAVGSDAKVVLRLENVSRLPTGVLLAEDRIPYLLGTRPRFVLERVEPRGTREVEYPVHCEVRGRYPIGPLSIRLTDPFGMCELERAFASRDVLVVTPVVQPLPWVALGGEWAGSGESRSRSLAAAGEDDVATREYRQGDDLRRVHWRSTARHGELMVRREEQPWESRAVLLLDTRAGAHRGDGPTSSFEAAVSVAASVGVHLGRGGFSVDLVTDTGARLGGAGGDDPGGSQDDQLLDALAVLEPSYGSSLRPAARTLRHAGDGLTVAVLAALTPEEAEDLVRVRHGAGAAVAVLLDVDTWRSPSDVAARAQQPVDLDGPTAVLRGAGWRVVPLRTGEPLAQVWPFAGHGGSAFAAGARR